MSGREFVRLGGLVELLEEHGLTIRGGFNRAEDEQLPANAAPNPAESVLLIGNAGDGFWPRFVAWLDGQPADLENPLDTWSRHVLDKAAEAFGARVIMPNDKPYAPFQQWAMRAVGLRPSPLGILMHPSFGLWHAYRGALLFDRKIAAEDLGKPARMPIHLCDLCIEKPCLNSCPVGAFGKLFDSGACYSHIASAGGHSCMEGGCLARNACPHDKFRYRDALQAFLMAAFRTALHPQ